VARNVHVQGRVVGAAHLGQLRRGDDQVERVEWTVWVSPTPFITMSVLWAARAWLAARAASLSSGDGRRREGRQTGVAPAPLRGCPSPSALEAPPLPRRARQARSPRAASRCRPADDRSAPAAEGRQLSLSTAASRCEQQAVFGVRLCLHSARQAHRAGHAFNPRLRALLSGCIDRRRLCCCWRGAAGCNRVLLSRRAREQA
jgi:hypothetical protein